MMGPGISIGAITQMAKGALPFIPVDSINSFRVGLCSLLICELQDTWQHHSRRMQSC